MTWSSLKSLHRLVCSANFTEAGDYTFGTTIGNYGNLDCLGSVISAKHFTISIGEDAGKPTYITNHSEFGTLVNGTSIANKKKGQILKTGDVIGVPGSIKIYTFRNYNDMQMQMNFPQMLLSEYFVETESIGRGGYGSVFIGHNIKTCNKYAIKKVKITPFSELETVMTRRLQPHVFIIRLLDVVYSPTHKYIIMELMSESLQERIDHSDGSLDELQAKVLCSQLVKAVEYMHSRDIVHRDIKAKNIMLKTKQPHAHLKLIDFGASKTDSALSSIVGTTL